MFRPIDQDVSDFHKIINGLTACRRQVRCLSTMLCFSKVIVRTFRLFLDSICRELAVEAVLTLSSLSSWTLSLAALIILPNPECEDFEFHEVVSRTSCQVSLDGGWWCVEVKNVGFSKTRHVLLCERTSALPPKFCHRKPQSLGIC